MVGNCKAGFWRLMIQAFGGLSFFTVNSYQLHCYAQMVANPYNELIFFPQKSLKRSLKLDDSRSVFAQVEIKSTPLQACHSTNVNYEANP